MSCILLPKHIECAIVDAHKDCCYLMTNNDTGWLGGLCVDLEKRTYKIKIIFDHDEDKVSLGYFKEFLKDNGWIEE